jgi:hypothetical protein
MTTVRTRLAGAEASITRTNRITDSLLPSWRCDRRLRRDCADPRLLEHDESRRMLLDGYLNTVEDRPHTQRRARSAANAASV